MSDFYQSMEAPVKIMLWSAVMAVGFGVASSFSLSPASSIKALQKECSTVGLEEGEGMERVELNYLDEFLLTKIGVPPVSTITWFRGDYHKAVSHLKRRVPLVLKRLPWLAGNIVAKKNGYELVYSKEAPSTRDPLLVVEDSPLARDTPLAKIPSLCARNELILTPKDDNDPSGLLWKIAVVPCQQNPSQSFAIVLSVSYIVGGGSTYYDVFNMLFQEESTHQDYIIERVPKVEDQKRELFTPEGYDYPSSPCLIHNFILGTVVTKLRPSSPQPHYFLVDDDKMADLKRKAASDAGLPFISTNDVLFSWFSQNSGTDYAFINVDCRGRLDSVTNLHMGNYQHPVIYSSREDAVTPARIRQSLSTQRRIARVGSTPLPSYWQSLWLQYGMTTNWASFSKPAQLAGCQEDLHLPITDQSDLPSTFTEMIIFRPSPGRTAVRLMGHNLPDKLKHPPFASDEVLK